MTNFEQNPGSGQKFLEKLKFSHWTCPRWCKMTSLSKILNWTNIFCKNWHFHPLHVHGGQKWQFWAKSCIGPTFFGKIDFFIRDISAVVKNYNLEVIPGSGQHFWKYWNFQPRHVHCGQKRQFQAKSWIGPLFLEKLTFSSSTCPRWSKMTILSKILDRANIFGKIEIFILDMSAVVKNDNFEQNPGSGQHFWKNWHFHAQLQMQFWVKSWIGPHLLEKMKFLGCTCLRWSKMIILSKILDRVKIFGKI